MEQAPYILGLVGKVRSVWSDPVDVVFVAPNSTQNWGPLIESPGNEVLGSDLRRAIAEIRRRVTPERYDLIHLAGWGHPVLMATLLLAAWRKIPVAVESDTPLPQSPDRLKALAKRLIYPHLFKLPTVFLPAGRRQADYLRHYSVDEAKIRIARMTVDVRSIIAYTSKFSREMKSESLRRYGLPEGHVRFLYLGRLEPHKGLSDLLTAFRRLRNERQDVSLLVAGDGTMKDVILSADLPAGSFHYLGRLAGDSVWQAYNISDVFVLPSRYEPWGLVINEAMAAALPVIVSDRVGCIDDLVRAGSTGLIVPAESASALLDAMRQLAEDGPSRRRMGTQGQRLISEWTHEAQAEALASAWELALPCA